MSKTSTDADVKNLATTMLPDLQHHLQMATETRQQVAANKTTTNTATKKTTNKTGKTE